ncbi:hypothetical protein MMC26_005348 [Xylographa opegraphella]|nr:hypothetical protein [Xylographa opegraphella]
MLPYGIQPGKVFGSARYNHKILDEDEIRSFFERAGMGNAPESSSRPPRRPNPQPRVIHLQRQPESQVQYPQDSNLLVHKKQHATERSTDRRFNIASDIVASPQLPVGARSSRGRGSGRLSSHRDLLALQRPSNVSLGGSSGTSLSELPKNSDQVMENVFCGHCQLFIDESRTVRMRAVGTTTGHNGGGLDIYVEPSNKKRKGEDVIESFPHYDNIGALQQSALNGCHLCSLFAAPDPTASELPPNYSSKPYSLWVHCKQNYDGPGRIEMDVQGHRPKTTYISYDRPLARIQGSLRYKRTDADEVLKLAKVWLESCLDHHEKCRHSSSGCGFVPTRLLKITTSGPVLLCVQLCLTNSKDFDPCTPYLALSHCWGASDILKLTKSSLPTFISNLPLASLPQNFSDAALITARLGYTYLWVDSLCIIQDCPEDWDKEAATMGNVYSNAVCTIAALGVTDSRGGCFVTRNPLSFEPCLLRDGDGRDTIWAENQRVQRPDSEGEMKPPLHRRAWVVQERALAPRTLYFGSEMVFWECLEGTASEEIPGLKAMASKNSDDRSDNPSLASSLGLKATLVTMKKSCRSGDWADWECFWWKMVKEYTASKLTFDSDKWTAFSGLAIAIEQHTQTRLYHGLWESNVFDELLWKVLKPGRRLDFDAPSWSWLSVDAGVHEQRYNYNSDFRQAATVSIPPSDNSQRSNKLSVRGRLLRFTSRVIHTGSGKREYKFKLQNGRPTPERSTDGRWHPDITPDEKWELSILQFVTTAYKESYGLVVRPLDASKTSWQRVGYYGMCWAHEDHGTQMAPPRYFGEIETVTLV